MPRQPDPPDTPALTPATGRAGPVRLRLIGPRDSVGILLALLDRYADLTAVSDPYPTRHGGDDVRVYATVTGRLIGGIR